MCEKQIGSVVINTVTHWHNIWNYILTEQLPPLLPLTELRFPASRKSFFIVVINKNVKWNRKVSQTLLVGVCPALIYITNPQLWWMVQGGEKESVFSP